MASSSTSSSHLRDLLAPSPWMTPTKPQRASIDDDADDDGNSECVADEEEEDTVMTWDSTFQPELFSFSSSAAAAAAPAGSTTMCPHAVVVGPHIYGGLRSLELESECERLAASASLDEEVDASATATGTGTGTGISSAPKRAPESHWWTWTRSLETHPKGSNNTHNSKFSNNNDTSETYSSSNSCSGVCGAGLVTCVASNASGTVIAVATDTGVVSLLRGLDGHVLATRQVCASFTSKNSRCNTNSNTSSNTNSNTNSSSTSTTGTTPGAIHLSWVSSPHESSDNDSEHDDDDGGDILWMELPVAADEDEATTLIVVTNVQGVRLNHSNPIVVAEAARHMQISPSFGLPPPFGHGDYGRNLRALTACVNVNSDDATCTTGTIRWIACDGNGTSLVVWDYELRQRSVTFVAGGLELTDDGTECLIDFDVGLVTQTTRHVSFVVCTAVVGPDVRLFWFDPVQLKTCCSFTLPTAARPDAAAVATTKVLAMESVESHNPDEALAVAVAIKSTQHGAPSICTFLIVQVLLCDDDTTPSMGLRHAHIMYTIPAPESMLSVVMASFDSSVGSSPYSFRCQVWYVAQQSTLPNNSSNCTYKEFQPHHSTSLAIGRIRTLLWRHEFDAADEMVATCSAHTLIRDGPAQFYPSEIAFLKLKYMLERQTPFKPSPDDTTEKRAIMQCLQRLACGAVAGGDTGMRLFLNVIDLVTRSPSTYTCEQFYTGLQSLAASILSVAERATPQYTNELSVKMKAVVGRIAALEFLSVASPVYPLTTPFTAVHSPKRLYQILVYESKFALAELLYRSNLQSQLTLKDLVQPVLHVSCNVHPRDYLALLRDIIIPSLSINHDLFSRLKLWSCQVADSFDDDGNDNMGLDAAISLLTVLDKGARVLQSHIFSSLGTRSPFAELPESRSAASASAFKSNNVVPGPTSSKCKHIAVVSACHYDKLPSPTILGHGGLTLQAPVPQTRSNFSDLPLSDIDDSLNVKLMAAQCLQQARVVGLGRSVTLRTFDSLGGVKNIATQLVRHLSASSLTHETRHQLFHTTLFPFCERFAVSKDQAMLDCVIDKCRGKNVSACSIEECCSIVRCCSSVTVRCQLALAVFRAALLCCSPQQELAQLSKDSISWASSDSILQSELKEASRILQIDLIVLKYCGSGARELFHVDNPRHATRLLDFVTMQVENVTVVSDALSLCDGFHHLCRLNAARKLMENAFVHMDETLHTRLFIELTEQSTLLAEHVLVTSIRFTEEILSECSKVMRSGCSSRELDVHCQGARLVASRIASLNRCAIEQGIDMTARFGSELNYILKDTTADVVRDAFVSIERLQRDHSVYVSLSELASTKAIVEKVAQFVEDLAHVFKTSDSDSVPKKFAEARRICTLLTVLCKFDAHDIWVAASTKIAKDLVGEHNDDVVEKFLYCMGSLTTSGQGLSSQAQVSTAVALCSEAMRLTTLDLIGMRKSVEALSLLNDWATRNASGKLLASVVAFAGHLDVACQVFSRCDETGEMVESKRHCLLAWSGMGQPIANASHSKSTLLCSTRSVHRPVLHQSWYIGDGLLLPPTESLPLCYQFCRGMINMHTTSDDGSANLWNLASGRGAHSLALRVLCHSSTIRASSSVLQDDGHLVSILDDAFCATTRSLAERNLGGTGSGITSSVVDSQQAVGFLLILPVKEAYDAYKSCIPTAIKTHNYRRLFILSNVGIVAASRENINIFSPLLGVGWKRQEKFLEQCERLSIESKWWSVLRDHGVDFDSQRFQDPKIISSSGKYDGPAMESKYAVTLLPALLKGMAGTLIHSDVARFATLYAKTFRFPRDLAMSRHAEFLLSVENSGLDCFDVCDLNRCKVAALSSLQFIQSSSSRAEVLRKCLVKLDTSATSGQDYERYDLVLNLYYEALLTVHDQQKPSPGNVGFEDEFAAICRRRDTLTILSAFFQGNLSSARPTFSAFFLPLPFAINDKQTKAQSCNILGSRENELLFDPLLPLEPILTSTYDNSVVTALAPLCVPLGLPQGFIHARSLMARFRRSQLSNGGYPSFENDVTPVLNRIVCHRDRALLVEWCTQQYSGHSLEKLKCLDVLLHAAITSSTEVEQRRKHFPIDKELEQMEVTALEELKQIGLRNDSLSCVLRARAVFLPLTASTIPAVKQLYELMIHELDSHSESHPDLSQESLVDFLFSKGSLIATQAILDMSETFSIRHFRQFCSTVHTACQSIADQHSHINPGHRAWRLAQRWLFYGDDLVSSLHVDDRQAPSLMATSSVDASHDEDTIDFVMDLSVIHEVGVNMTKDVTIGAPAKELCNVISTEEASVLQSCSIREQSDAATQRAALRIAFVLAFSYAFPDVSSDTNSKENSGSASHNIGEKNGLLARIPTERRNKQTSDQCSELLRIVFAKPGDSSHLMKGLRLFATDSSVELQRMGTPQTITFAMRHMALQTAAILCPQVALEEDIRKEGYLRTPTIEKPPSLRECAFGAFVAKEVEEMGLPLPHSDLMQLSSMNFLSYSRILWRHHREDSVIQNSKGRLLRLLIEMSLRHDETDATFINNLIDEMMRINLPRTLLLSLERIAEYQSKSDILALLSRTLIENSIGSVVSLGLREAEELLAEPSAMGNAVIYLDLASSFDSLCKVSFALLDSKSANQALRMYADRLTALFEATKCPLVTNLHRNISESRERCEKQHRFVKVDAFVKFSEFSSLTGVDSTGRSTKTPIPKSRD